MKYDFDDIMLEFCDITQISSRKEINLLDKLNMLPLITAPMDTVVNNDNTSYFIKQGIYTVLPRQAKMPQLSTSPYIRHSYSLAQFKTEFLEHDMTDILKNNTAYALIDITNGHMQILFDIVTEAKQKYGNKLNLMVGNIANPKTFVLLSEAGADSIRVGIGAGSGCLTSEQTAVNYPSASLIKETYNLANQLNNPAKIIADGGFKKYSDIIKGLALGADYIMLGGIFNRCLESCADTYAANIKHDNWTEPGEQVNQFDEITKLTFKNGTRYFKKFRGMSTKAVQKSLGSDIIKTSEGVTRMNEVKYTVKGWIENFKDYLKSAMSYTDKRNIKEFIGEAKTIFITPNAFKRFNK